VTPRGRLALLGMAVGLAGATAALSTDGAPRALAGTGTADGREDARAAHDYLLSCGGCHGLDGAGAGRVPSLRGVDRLLAKAGGRDYLLRVPGVASAPLSDTRLAALLDWVFVSFGNDTRTRFTAVEVGRARSEPFVDPQAARAALH
jgi:mono/diheme cytochrome c family protein